MVASHLLTKVAINSSTDYLENCLYGLMDARRRPHHAIYSSYKEGSRATKKKTRGYGVLLNQTCPL